MTAPLILKIPDKPQVLEQLDALLQSEEATVDQVAHIIAQDGATAAEVFRLANSAIFAADRRFVSVSQAVNFLGLHVVASIVQMAYFKKAFGVGQAFSELWSLSSRRSALAYRLAHSLDLPAHQAHTVALFIDAGRMVMSHEPRYREMFLSRPGEQAMATFERDLFGCTSQDVTSLMAKRWGLAGPVMSVLSGERDSTEAGTLGQLLDLAHAVAVNDEIPEHALEVAAATFGRPSVVVQERLARLGDLSTE